MKNFIIGVVSGFLFWSIILYLIGAFIASDFNSANWHEGAKLLLSFSWILMSMTTGFFISQIMDMEE